MGEQATESSVARTGQSLLGIYSDPEWSQLEAMLHSFLGMMTMAWNSENSGACNFFQYFCRRGHTSQHGTMYDV